MNLTEKQINEAKLLRDKTSEVIAEEEEKQPVHGWSQSQVMFDDNGCSLILDLGNADGSHRVCWIRLSYWRHRPDEPGFQIKRYTHNSEDYWEEQLRDRDNALVIESTHYRVHKDGRQGESSGYGGHLFKIEVDKELAEALRKQGLNIIQDRQNTYVLHTRNLWHQGPIPPALRDKFPDNAMWYKEAV